jgi:amidase
MMTSNTPLSGLSATVLARMVATKAISPVELLETHLAAVETWNPIINAICTLDADNARNAAKAAEAAVIRGDALGPLHGLPLGIKDVTPTAGLRTTYGSPLFAGHVPTESAAVVTRLSDAGAILLGKTNTPEFAAGANTVNAVFGATRNPHNTDLTVGGSTGGGAAAVATGMIALAEGTDFGGSLRVPASFCGVVGLRPTAGLIPSHPVPDPWDTGRTHGPMARRVEDIVLMLPAMCGLSDLSAISVTPPWASLATAVQDAAKKKLRIGAALDIAGVGIDPVVSSAFEKSVATLSAEHPVEIIDFDIGAGRTAYQTLRGLWMTVQYQSHLDNLIRLGVNVRGNIEAGLKVSIRDLADAHRVRAELWHRWRTLFSRFDVLITPTVPVEPFPVVENYPTSIAGRKLTNYIDWIAPTFLVTLAGLPAISVPFGETSGGLPLGLQIIGRRFSEPTLLALAGAVEQLFPVRPPIPRPQNR